MQYPVSESQREQLIASQNDKCAICARRGIDLHVDHDHDTGEVRGMLCHNCNIGLGWMGDSPYRLILAANYLGQFKGIRQPLASFPSYPKAKRQVCRGSWEMPIQTPTWGRGPGLFRCGTCDRPDIKCRKVGTYKGNPLYMLYEHYKRRGEGPATRFPAFLKNREAFITN